MNARIHRSIRGRRGAALLYAILASFAAATMVSMMFTLTMSSKRVSDVSVHRSQARYLAEGALEAAKQSVQADIANWRTPAATGTTTINGEQVPFTVAQTGLNTISTDPAGIQTIVTGYEITATHTVQGNTLTAHRFINARATPVFQFAVFYTNDLEINPGPNMTLGGRVHTNQDMYLNCGGTLTLNTNYVHAVGSMFRNRKDNPSLSEGTVKIRQYVNNPFSGSEPTSYVQMNSIAQMSSLGIATTSGYDSAFLSGFDSNADGDFYDTGEFMPWGPGALNYWGPPTGYGSGYGNTVMDSAHGVTQAAVPYIGSIQMFEPVTGGDYYFDNATQTYQACAPGTGTHNPGYYHDQAGLSVIGYVDGTWKAFDGSGNDVTASLTSAVHTKKLYDARQANGSSTKIDTLEICVDCLKSSGKFPSNGLVYAAMYGAGTGTNCKGIKLVNGSDLGAPLTVVSENSIYIQGDYNTTNKKGAAVIADAVNLLSNSWNDSKAKGSGLPNASNTTYNVAIISGNQDTTGSAYNGGLENLPRFHENWSGKNCVIKGSFVNTWQSGYASGNWVYGSDRYTAPNRVWSYDTAFNTVSNLPPFTPMSVTAEDVATW